MQWLNDTLVQSIPARQAADGVHVHKSHLEHEGSQYFTCIDLKQRGDRPLVLQQETFYWCKVVWLIF